MQKSPEKGSLVQFFNLQAQVVWLLFHNNIIICISFFDEKQKKARGEGNIVY